MTKIKFDKCFTGNKKVSIEDMVTYNGRLRREYNPGCLVLSFVQEGPVEVYVSYIAEGSISFHLAGCSSLSQLFLWRPDGI